MIRSVTRRSFLVASLVGLAAPLAAGAQQAGKVWRIGWLGVTPPTSPPLQRSSEAFLQGLRDHGFVEGQNVIIERRYSGVERTGTLHSWLSSSK